MLNTLLIRLCICSVMYASLLKIQTVSINSEKTTENHTFERFPQENYYEEDARNQEQMN